MWTLYLSAVGLLIAAANLPSSVATDCDFAYDIGAQSSFQMTRCDFRQDQQELTLARAKFFSTERATVQVTCTATDGTELYTNTERTRSNSNIKIEAMDIDSQMLNGANCTVTGCYDSDSGTITYRIPTNSCIVDFDECSEGNHDCPSNTAVCMNHPRGSYTCKCTSAGYTFNSTTSQCIDTDECENGACAEYGPNANCINTNGSYECGCAQGYRNNRTFCENVDECADGTHNCSSNAKCTDTDGSFTCDCLDGFIGNGQLCEDTNECETNTSACAEYGPNASCINTNGDYECGCARGYRIRSNGAFCENVDECADGAHNCSSNAKCTDTDGSFFCNCTNGFTGNGQLCEVAIIGDPDDSARQAGLTALLAVLVIILFVLVIVSVILGTIYCVKWRRDHKTKNWLAS